MQTRDTSSPGVEGLWVILVQLIGAGVDDSVFRQPILSSAKSTLYVTYAGLHSCEDCDSTLSSRRRLGAAWQAQIWHTPQNRQLSTLASKKSCHQVKKGQS